MDRREREFGDEKCRDLEDPLGIAQTPVSKDDRIRASSDEASARRRRRRMLDDERRTIPGASDDPEGATGMDMGAGGDGHGIKTSR